MQCEYCRETLSTKYSLKTHQLTAKSCLKIQAIKKHYREKKERRIDRVRTYIENIVENNPEKQKYYEHILNRLPYKIG